MRVQQLIELLEAVPQHYDVRVEHGLLSLDVAQVVIAHGSAVLKDSIEISEEE